MDKSSFFLSKKKLIKKMFAKPHPYIRRRYNEMMTAGPRIYTPPTSWIDLYTAIPYDQNYPFPPVMTGRYVYVRKQIN